MSQRFRLPHPKRTSRLIGGFAAAAMGVLMGSAALSQGPATNVQSFVNSAGVLRTFSTQGFIDRNNPFFKPLGKQFATTCEHCHFASDAWGVSGAHINQLFTTTNGQHPLFTPNSSNDLVAALTLGNGGTVAQRQALYSLILNKGDALVRRNFPAAGNVADFTLLGVETTTIDAASHGLPTVTYTDPSDSSTHTLIDGTAYLNFTAAANGGVKQFWVHRRPLPTTNFRFLTAAAWDGQDTRQSPNPVVRPTHAGVFDIAKATIKTRQTGASLIAPDGHVYSDAEQNTLANQMTDFMFSLFVAQDLDKLAGQLYSNGGQGGVYKLAALDFHDGANDVLQGDHFFNAAGQQVFSGNPFTPVIFTQYDAWNGSRNAARASIARGQALFNSQRLTVEGVTGLNDSKITLPNLTVIDGPSGAFTGSCGTCHDSPGLGNHSTRLPINIGIADASPAFFGRARVADLPLFYLKNNATNEVRTTTDPGRAIVTGKWAHIGEFKGPILHGLAARAPYFHNGMAETLDEAVEFYSQRFQGHFTAQEKADLVAFLKTL